ncbi:nucleolar protein 9 [Ostrinia nubilalis]|uniref:nucleolar protein 9 n=1 Tax=Ostrinia nubilalis TaxID=29057 RepID=UPI0030825200
MSEETPANGFPKKRNRTKRKNFLANAKKYAKKGQMGRGTRMPDELYQYFVGILDAMKQGVENKEERESLVNNVLERTKDEELNIVGNQLGCRVIELLLPFASAADLERFIEVLSPELRRLCSDNFSSHVVETLLRVSCERAIEKLQVIEDEEEVPKKKKKTETEPESEYSEEHVQKCYEFTIKICKYALNNLEDFVWDSYANHILRSALKCLSGITLLPGEKPKTNMFKVTLPDNKGIPPHLTKMEYKIVPDEFKELVKEFANRLSAWPQFKDLPYQNLTSALLQVLLYAIRNVDNSITKNLLKKLLDESFAPDDWVSNANDEKKNDEKIEVDSKDNVKESSNMESGELPPVFGDQSAVRLLEAALFVAKKKMYTQIYAKCFINRLGQLATVPMLNFTVQRLIDNCQCKEEFEPMFDELSAKFGALVIGNTGVLVAIAKACVRLRARQALFVAFEPMFDELARQDCARDVPNLEAALECSTEAGQKYFSVACLRLLPLSRLDTSQLHDDYFIHVHGSVMLQSILEFQLSLVGDLQKYFSVACLRLLPLSRLDTSQLHDDYFIHVHGSVMLQSILEFQRPAKAVNSLLELSAEELLVVLRDAKGSHVADAFCRSACVGGKARDKLVWRLKGYYQTLALSQHGSRAFERIFESCSPEQKIKLMAEISDKSSLLNGTDYGRIIAQKLDVDTFKANQQRWEQKYLKRAAESGNKD